MLKYKHERVVGATKSSNYASSKSPMRCRGQQSMTQANSSDQPSSTSRQGFTVIEVMLVLGITGLMLAGILAGTYSSIATQRYNDSVRSFSEFLRTLYAEVISPQSYGAGNSDNEAVYGKVAVFGLNDSGDDVIYTATLVGKVDPPRDQTNFIDELASVNAHLFCGKDADTSSTVDSYTPMWEAKIVNPEGVYRANQQTKGTLIIARSPASGVVHTAFSSEVQPNLKEQCSPEQGNAASATLQSAIVDHGDQFDIKNDIDFCIVSDNSRIVRDVRLTADGHNSSAVNLIPVDGDVKCAR